jgi:hypothetical protein
MVIWVDYTSGLTGSGTKVHSVRILGQTIYERMAIAEKPTKFLPAQTKSESKLSNFVRVEHGRID